MTEPLPIPPVESSLNPEQQNAILGSITTLLVHRLPGNWEHFFLDFRMMGSHLETEASGLTVFGSSFQWQLPDEALPLFLELRQGMARPETGTWLSLKFRLSHPSTYSVEYNRDLEPEWLHAPEPKHYAEELEWYPRAATSTPGWLAERAGSTVLPEPAAPHQPDLEERGTLFAAPVFDDAGKHSEPSPDRPAVHPQELDEVLAYLENAPVALAARGYGEDAFKPDDPPAVPLTFHTDGAWVWPGGVAYYLRAHRIPPVPQLVQHIRDNGYRLPEVDGESQKLAARIATGQAESADLPAFQPRVISDADQRALDRLRQRLEYHGVRPEEYGIVSPKVDALVIEPAPGPAGWQVQFWDADRGPTGKPTVFEHAVDAAKVLLAELLWRDDLDATRASQSEPPAPKPVAPVSSAVDIQSLPDEPPLSILGNREFIMVPIGVELDRFGGDGGNLVYAAGTAFGERSLPPDWLARPYHVYRVARPVAAVWGVAVPWFDQPGGGTGYFLVRAVRELLADGSLVDVATESASQN